MSENQETALHVLPLIPTRGVIVFPGQSVVIEVGRPMSLKALNLSQQNFESKVVLTCQKDAATVDPNLNDLYTTGTCCRIRVIHDKGNFARVTFLGEQRVSIANIHTQDNVLLADYTPIKTVSGNMMEQTALANQIVKNFEASTQSLRQFPSEILAKLTSGLTAEELADQFGQYYPMSLAKKQELLGMANLNERLMFCLTTLEADREMVQVESQLNAKVKERIDQGQKEYYLREKLRAIKEELGDVSNFSDDTAELRERIEKGNYPQHVKDKALDELNHYEMLPMGSQEGSVIRSYLDWLLGIPWSEETSDNTDILEIERRLDADHYGLKKVKQRILEYIAVKQNTNSLNAPILCLVGPPGVGKTSLAKSVANALDRHFVKISLGGVRDEAEIRGHRRTYLGALPGRIIQGMKKAEVINPVFLIDEIDKMASDYKGDPSSAMLEVLDPEQNTAFRDRFLEVPYDLSKVLFITTANTVDTIPAPLLDRMELIELNGYTLDEKREIARRYLIPKKIKENGLREDLLEITDGAITDIIEGYTMEAGVRSLERQIGSVCRKIAVRYAENSGMEKQTVTEENLESILGVRKYSRDVSKLDGDEVGAATGLAWTAVGGMPLTIEVSAMQGKGDILLTGKLGDVMKESARAAISYIRAHADKYGISDEAFEHRDIHIHVPEGATPKDGPSAGITMATAILSAFTGQPVRRDVAMTGEITLRGKVLPIGGLKEKAMAASRIGIRDVIIPEDNKKDVEEIPENVRKNLNFICVNNIDQVFRNAVTGMNYAG